MLAEKTDVLQWKQRKPIALKTDWQRWRHRGSIAVVVCAVVGLVQETIGVLWWLLHAR